MFVYKFATFSLQNIIGLDAGVDEIYQKRVRSSGVPNTEKVMKARGRRPSAFIVSMCLEPRMKHEAQVFDTELFK